MKAPNTINELKEIIKNMEHRERFIFKVPSMTDTNIEVYHTLLESNYKSNICLTFVNGDKNKPRNRLLKLWSEKNYENLFNLIK